MHLIEIQRVIGIGERAPCCPYPEIQGCEEETEMAKTSKACLVLSLAVMSAGTLTAASHRSPLKSNPDVPTTNRAQTEATKLLTQVEDHAQSILEAIEPLDTRVRYAEVDAQTQSDELEIARDNINAMAGELQKLEKSQTKLQPWQQRELMRIQPLAVELAGATKDAIQTFNQSKNRSWATQLPHELETMVEKADAIRNSVDESKEVARLTRKIDHIDHKG